MATTENNFSGNGTAGPFTYTFPVIEAGDVKVFVNGVSVANYTVDTTLSTVTFTAPFPTAGQAIRIFRETNIDTLAAEFSAGSAIRASDLNDNFIQNLYVTQEISNNAILTDGSNAFDGDLNMGGNQITNLGTPAVDSDAVTKLYVDSRFSSQSIPGYTRWRTTATASQTVFSGVGESGGTLAYSATRENVYVNGALQQRTVDYTADNGTTITFIVGLQAGDIVDVVCVNNVSTVTSDQSSEVYFLQSGTGATTRTVESKLRDVVSVKDFGAVGDGVTDDTAAIQAAIDYVFNNGGGTVTFTDRHLIDSELIIKDYVNLKGPLNVPDELRFTSGFDYDGQKGVLVINSAVSLKPKDGSAITDCVIIRKGLDLPFVDSAAATAGVAAFAGTAIDVQGAGTFMGNLLILGFNKAIYSNNFERVRCEYVQGDNTNGIEIITSFDISYVENCHFWPFTTVHQPGVTTDALLTRTGTAYACSNIGDWSKFTNCFSFGYQTGFSVDSCDHVQLISCGTDHVSAIVGNTSVGYKVLGTARNTNFVACQAAAQGTGIYVNTSDTLNPVKITGCDFWGNDTYGIHVNSGTANITANTFSEATGIQCETAGKCTIIGNNFNNAPIALVGASNIVSIVSDNRFVGASVDTTIGKRGVYDNVFADNRTLVAKNGVGIAAKHEYLFARGSLSSPTISQNLDVPFTLEGKVYDGNTYQSIASFRAFAQGTPSAGSTRGAWAFATSPSASVIPTDKLVIYGDGQVAPGTDNTQSLGLNSLRWADSYSTNLRPGAGTVIWTSGTGTPEGVVTATVGSLFTRTDGGASTTLYVKESGTGNTGWVAK